MENEGNSRFLLAQRCALALTLVGCGSSSSSSTGPDGGSNSPDSAAIDSSAAPDVVTSSGGNDAARSESTADGASSGGGGHDASASGAGDAYAPPAGDGGSSAASTLAAALGRPNRFLIGLGGTDQSVIQSQGIKVDVFDRYLVGVGSGSWPDWNSPSGAYVDQVVAASADALGAVPMFTLYQMATAGDGNIAGVIGSSSMMTSYWANALLLFQRLALYGKPALVNIEPDFWGYAILENTDPTQTSVFVTINSDCTSLSNDVAGFGKCLLLMARKYAPKTLIGFPPADWGQGTAAVIAFLRQVGAADADFVVMQTLDGDAGCFEAAANTKCQRQGSGWYWDETNTTSPNFHDHLATVQQYSVGLGRPVVWWQTPLGVVSSTPGGTTNHYRDNRVHYFMTHASELVAAGGLAAVFSAGDSDETDVTTDNGNFQTLSASYLANPAPLP